MSVDEGMLLAPLDPKFRPSFEMFQAMCDFLVSKSLSQETFKYSFHEKFLSLERLELFPKTFNYLEPNQWTSRNLELYEDLFNFEDVFDDNDEVRVHREYYRDNAGLRGEREELPWGDFEKPYFYRHELNKLKRYFNDRYFLRMWIPLGQKLDMELSELNLNTNTETILIRYGFHYQENRSIMKEDKQEYLQLFPYAPKVVRDGHNPYNRQLDELLLTYAGCFSLTFYSLTPLYGKEGMLYWPPGLTAAKSLEQLKSTPIFYHELKQGLEKIFNQPMDVFIGVW